MSGTESWYDRWWQYLKVLLIAGGSGSRAKPFSQYTPKPMISLDGRPIIDHIVRYLARSPEVDNFVIVCEFDDHGKQIINYFKKVKSK